MQIPEHVLHALRELVTSEFDRLHEVARQEAQAYKIERDALRDERQKLMQAHYAGAVPLDLLGSEQDRIARRLASSTPRSTPETSSMNKPKRTWRTASPSQATCMPST